MPPKRRQAPPAKSTVGTKRSTRRTPVPLPEDKQSSPASSAKKNTDTDALADTTPLKRGDGSRVQAVVKLIDSPPGLDAMSSITAISKASLPSNKSKSSKSNASKSSASITSIF